MDIITMIVVAIGLSMDCLAVAIASGLSIRNHRIEIAFKMGCFFGFFQSIMLIIGWLFGQSLILIISGFDHWIAFALLAFIGIKMIYESLTKEENKEKEIDITPYTLILLSIATSIDSLAVGLSLSLLDIFILLPTAIIGITSFTLSFFGAIVSEKIGGIFSNKVEILGGLVLIIIGLRILIEHIF